MSTLYQKAKDLLFEEYNTNYKIVQSSNYHRGYMDEKIKHSLQVAGAGNGILRNEAYFQNRTPEFVEIAKTAILLHDIFRFREIKILYETGQKVDHGVKGYELLKSIPDFNNILITLPVKHHGHMIEELYADEEYKSITDEQIKEDVKHIAFAVRDADKIANWYLIVREWDSMKPLWLNNHENKSYEINNAVWNTFLSKNAIKHALVKTNADKILATLCWLFDINYPSSIKYSLRLNIFKGFYEHFSEYNIPKQQASKIKEVLDLYINKHFNLSI